MSNNITFKSFAELAAHLAAEKRGAAQAQNHDDVRKANALVRSRALARNRKAGIGPRVAR